MLAPKKYKYRKQMGGNNRGISTRGYTLAFGEFGLKAIGRGLLSSRQIESARKAITGVTKRTGKMWIMVFPDKPITKKPLEVRMGKGMGSVEYYAAVVRPGKIVFELSGVSEEVAVEAFRIASHKLPIKCVFVNSKI